MNSCYQSEVTFANKIIEIDENNLLVSYAKITGVVGDLIKIFPSSLVLSTSNSNNFSIGDSTLDFNVSFTIAGTVSYSYALKKYSEAIEKYGILSYDTQKEVVVAKYTVAF